MPSVQTIDAPSKQAQVEAALGESVHAWLTERRSHRYEPSWQQLADEIHDLTGVTVSRELVRQWATS